MKLQQMTNQELIEKKNRLLNKLKTAKGLTRRDLYKSLNNIEKERVRRAWEKNQK